MSLFSGNSFSSWTIQDFGALAAIVFGIIGGIWALITSITSHRYPRIIYEVDEISDFKMPEHLLNAIAQSPAKVLIKSSGRVLAENIRITIETTRKIESVISKPVYAMGGTEKSIVFGVEKMNPSECIEMSILCSGSPKDTMFSRFEITHADGAAVRLERGKREPIRFQLGLLSLVYDPSIGGLTSIRLG